MIPITQLAIIEKNKLSSEHPWILLVEIRLNENEIVRLCRNTENIEFEGETWYAYDVQVGEIQEDNENTVTSIDLKLANINGMLDAQIDQYSGLTNSEILLHTVLITDDIKSKELTLSFYVSGSRMQNDYLNLTLTGFNPFEVKCPRATLRKLVCRYKEFKGERCRYYGSETYCDRTLKRCQELNNEKNFGGAPTMGWSGVFI